MITLKFPTALALSVSILTAIAAPAVAQTPPAAEWRSVTPENLLVIETAKGRILVELDPRVAPLAVARVRSLADEGFYDGLKFHRVITGFMAQTGDPLGTGQGGSPLPDLPGEFTFRRGRDTGFARVGTTPQGLSGIVGSLPVVTQPDAQMMVTADFKTGAQALFCPGVAGMARAAEPNSANSQFFLMTGIKTDLDGKYTPFGRVVAGMEVVGALNAGDQDPNGRVESPDVMARVRTAAALPESQRPVVRVMSTTSPAFAELVARTQAERGTRFNICDIQPPVEATGS